MMKWTHGWQRTAGLTALPLAVAVGLSAPAQAQCPTCYEQIPGQSNWIDFEPLAVFDACVPMTPPAGYQVEKDLIAEDFDQDGDMDIFRSLALAGGEAVWNSVVCPPPGGPFFDSVDNAITGGVPYMLAVADIDGDGDMDGYTGTDQCDFVTINTGAANPSNWTRYPIYATRTSDNAGNVIWTDLDNDGLLDWIVGDIDQTAGICGPFAPEAGLALLRTVRDAQGNPIGAEDPNELAGPCAIPCTNPNDLCTRVIDEVWNTKRVFDAVFFDIDQNGYQDMLLGTCDGFQFFRMKPFFEKDPTCDCDPAAVKLSLGGNPSVSQNVMTLRASGAPANAPGLFFFSPTKLANGVPSFDGTVCVGPATRLTPTAADANGDFSYQLDFTQYPSLQPGDTLYFQLQYRDPSGPTGVNYSDVMEVTLWN